MAFWDLVFYLKDYEGVSQMNSDTFWEAYSAYEKLSENIDKGGD